MLQLTTGFETSPHRAIHSTDEVQNENSSYFECLKPTNDIKTSEECRLKMIYSTSLKTDERKLMMSTFFASLQLMSLSKH